MGSFFILPKVFLGCCVGFDVALLFEPQFELNILLEHFTLYRNLSTFQVSVISG